MACAFIRSMLHSGLCNYRGASIIDEFLILNRKMSREVSNLQ
jgi:hypothetical protein